MTTVEGYFARPAYLSVGDEYDKRQKGKGEDKDKEKDKKAAFKVSGGRRGKGTDALFDKKVLSLAEGDKYVDPGARERRERLAASQAKKTTPFAYASRHATKSVIPGLLGEYPKHEPEFDPVRKGEIPAKKATLAPPNMKTSPGPKGGYGTWGTTLSKDAYRYVSDPYGYDPAKAKAAAGGDKEKKDEKRVPFRAAVRRTGGFDIMEATGASKVYTLDQPLPASSKPKPAEGAAEGGEKKAGEKGASWKPAGGTRSGAHVFISGSRFEYREDPYDMRVGADKTKKAEGDAAKQSAAHWKPVSGPKTTLQRSIAFNPAVTS